MTISPTAKALARQLRADLGITGSRSKVPGGVIPTIYRIEGHGDSGWPYSVRTAVLGIDFAVSTGRLDHTIVTQIRALSDWRKVDLVADIATECPTQGDIPRYLIDRFIAARPERR